MSSPSRVVDHAGLVVSDLVVSRLLYEAALLPLGYIVLRQSETTVSIGVPSGDDLGISSGEPVTHNAHVAFVARDQNAVQAFYAAALARGGRDNGVPGYHREYHPTCYAAFVLNPDGNNIEAVFHGL